MRVDEFMRRLTGVSDEEFDLQARIGRLATYNSEVARGIVHTFEWKELMKLEQRWWDENHGGVPR